MMFTPIGYFHTEKIHPFEAGRQASVVSAPGLGEIRLERQRDFESALDDLIGFERIWILYHFHHNTHWKPKVMPPRGPRLKRGTFATRAPFRPNPIGMSCVKLRHIDGLSVFVEGHDLLDGTPVLDLKPYLPYADSFPEAKVGWLEDIEHRAWSVIFNINAQNQIDWLELNNLTQLKSFIQNQLEYEPLDQKRKRVESIGGDQYRLAYRTWRIRFQTFLIEQKIEVLDIASGYSPADLLTGLDPYADKQLHMQYLKKFRL